MTGKLRTSKDTNFLQFYVEPELHKALGLYCLETIQKTLPW